MNETGRQEIYYSGKTYHSYFHFFPQAYSVNRRKIPVAMESEIYQKYREKKLDESCILYYSLLHEGFGGAMIVLTTEGNDEICETDEMSCQRVSFQTVEALKPKGRKDRICKILHGLSLCYPRLGETFSVGNDETYHWKLSDDTNLLLFCESMDESVVSDALHYLVDAKYLEKTCRKSSTEGSQAMLSPEAWKIMGQSQNLWDSNSLDE